MRTKRSIANTLLLLLMGAGVFFIIFQSDTANAQPKKARLTEENKDLGDIRFSKPSLWFDITVRNLGNDTTTVMSIVFVSGDVNEFEFDSFTIPAFNNPFFLDTAGSIDTALKKQTDRFTFKFRANLIPKTISSPDLNGSRSVVIRITSTDSVYYDTVLCRGVEPWFESSPDTVNFGTIVDPPYQSPLTTSRTYFIHNSGSGEGNLMELRNFNPHFTIKEPTRPGSIPVVDGGDTKADTVYFNCTEPGEYSDSAIFNNDSRVRVVTYLLAVVRAHLQFTPYFDLGSFSDCTPLDTSISFHNPTSLTITIDSLFLEGQTGGFEITSPSPLVFPIIVKPNETFRLGIKYAYPPDSANGGQTTSLIVKQPLGGESIEFRYDSVHFILNRKLVELALASAPPPYKPNALDAPFRLPIYLKGDRIGRSELNDITVHLKFSNDLLQPIGVDRSGSLSEESVANGIPKQPIGIWDESTKTYSVSSNNIKLSSNAGKNTLLFTVLTRAFLTTDSAVTMYEYLDYNTAKPCGYHVLRDSLVIDYADECGDATIRRAVLQNKSIITFHAPQPDPAVMSEFGKITIPFDAATEIDLGWKLYNESGAIIDNGNSQFQAGKNTLVIERNTITSSGVFILKADVRDPDGRIFSFSTKFSVVK